jgi:hypothetical protein
VTNVASRGGGACQWRQVAASDALWAMLERHAHFRHHPEFRSPSSPARSVLVHPALTRQGGRALAVHNTGVMSNTNRSCAVRSFGTLLVRHV